MSTALAVNRPAGTLHTYSNERDSGEAARGYTTPLIYSVEEALFTSTRDTVLLVNLDMLVVFANMHAEKQFGYTPAELIAAPFHLLLAERCRTLYAHFWQRHLSNWHEVELEPVLEVLAQHKDGTAFPIEIRLSLVKHDRGVYVLHVIRDLRQRNDVLEELRQAQKMEVIGRLAGGVAHDFNNVLTVMNGYSQILADRVDVDERVRSMAKEIGKAGERGASITGQLLAFSRRQPVDPQVLNLRQSIGDIEKMLRRLVGENVQLRKQVPQALGQILADAGQIDQVLLNLVVNARDAMPNGGTITLSADNIEVVEESGEEQPNLPVGHYVQLAVEDTGCGMDEKTKARIFEPLFTTKGPGKGTGLGLSIVQQVVQQSDGYITVASEPRRGSKFNLFFPRLDTPRATTKPQLQKPIPRGHEVVLLVEDDDAVRTLIQEALEQYGYKVLAAKDADAAIPLFRQNAVPIVVADVVLPQLSGPKLVDLFKTESPDLKVLFVSGYTDETDLREVRPGDPLLLKPFTPSLLAIRIREVLDGC